MGAADIVPGVSGGTVALVLGIYRQLIEALHSCVAVVLKLLRGDLTARFYYLYAVDYDQGGEWAGKAPMCTREKEFTIRGAEDCLARGFERTGFIEVDTQEQKSWTVQLTEANQSRAPAAMAPLPPPPPPGVRRTP